MTHFGGNQFPSPLPSASLLLGLGISLSLALVFISLLALALSIHFFLQIGKSDPNQHHPTAWCPLTTASNPGVVGARAEAEHAKVGIRRHQVGFSHPRCCVHLVWMLSYAGMVQQKTFTHPLPHPVCRKASPAGQLEAFRSSPSGRAQRFTEEESSRISCIWMTSCWTTDVLLDVNIAALNGHSRGNWPKTESLRLNTSCSA